MKIKHTRERDFVEVESEYPDFQYAIAEEIHEVLGSNFPILANDDGDKLIILIRDEIEYNSLTRMEKEIGKGSYRIIIERVNGDTLEK